MRATGSAGVELDVHLSPALAILVLLTFSPLCLFHTTRDGRRNGFTGNHTGYDEGRATFIMHAFIVYSSLPPLTLISISR